MRYRKGDRVRVKSLEWYYANKNSEGAVIFDNFRIFDESMSEFCGKVVTIDAYIPRGNYYDIKEDGKVNFWEDDMFEGLAIEESQENMVSLDDVCGALYDMLHELDINGHTMVGTWEYDNVADFIKDFRKRLKE